MSRFCFFFSFRFFRACCVFGLSTVTVAVNGPNGWRAELVEWSVDVHEICALRKSVYVVCVTSTGPNFRYTRCLFYSFVLVPVLARCSDKK